MAATRDHFSSRLGVLAATLGSAVGLGNIWKFPALVGQNGGASFLLVYILATLCIGLPLMIAELAIGRAGRRNVVDVFRTVAPRSGWWLIGMGAILSCIVILGFYSDVAGWVFAYIFKSALGGTATTDPEAAGKTFSLLTCDPLASLGWQWCVLILTGAIIMRGASKGIEKVTRVLMPLLFLLLVGICLRSLTLPGAGEGLRFLFMPQWDRISGEVILTAMGLAFFKMSVGMGCMLIYGSYFKEEVNIPATALRVMVCDLLVSLLAGIAIFPAVFSFDFEVTQGPALLFMTIQDILRSRSAKKADDTAHMLGDSFYAIYRINFVNGTYECFKTSSTLQGILPERGDYAIFLEAMRPLVKPSTYQAFESSFSLESIRTRTAQDIPDYGGDYQRLFDDTYRWVNIRSLYNRDLFPDEVILCFRDVDEEKRRDLQHTIILQDALEAAQKSTKAKTDFFSRMSHDMRTPLTAAAPWWKKVMLPAMATRRGVTSKRSILRPTSCSPSSMIFWNCRRPRPAKPAWIKRNWISGSFC